MVVLVRVVERVQIRTRIMGCRNRSSTDDRSGSMQRLPIVVVLERVLGMASEDALCGSPAASTDVAHFPIFRSRREKFARIFINEHIAACRGRAGHH